MGRQSRRCSLQSSRCRTPAIRPRTSRRAVPPGRWPSTVIPPTAPAVSWTRSSKPTWRSCAKVQAPNAPAGRYAKDAFQIDLTAGTVTCPAGRLAELRPIKNGHIAHFGNACRSCPLADRCTTSTDGRSIHVGLYEQQLQRARARQTNPAWKADYTATRPKVERKISHLMRRRHGGRRARVRGHTKVDADFSLLAAAVNLAR